MLDLFTLIAAALLLAAALLALRWTHALRPAARAQWRFALLLFAAQGVAGLVGGVLPAFTPVALATAILSSALGSAALCLGVFAIFSRPVSSLSASVILVLALGCGLAAILGNQPIYAVAVQVMAFAGIVVLGFGRLGDAVHSGALTVAGAFALLCEGMAIMDGAVSIALLFAAAAMLGLARASQFGVEQPRRRKDGRRIG